MASVAVIPATALIAGAVLGIVRARPIAGVVVLLLAVWMTAVLTWFAGRRFVPVLCVTFGYGAAGLTLGADAASEALAPSIRTLLDREVGGFALTTPGPPADHEPITIRARLVEDAVPRTPALRNGQPAVRESLSASRTRELESPMAAADAFASVRVDVESLCIRDAWHPVRGGVRLSIGGAAVRERAAAWRAGRVVEVPVTFRRPVRYLNNGVPDFERDLALDGIALHASAKSALLVTVVRNGTRVQELAADARALIRSRVQHWVGAHDPLAAGIVTAILIGDRTGLPDDVRTRLQAAGTYHVIAISGGNIAILAALMAVLLLVTGASGRWSSTAIIVGLLAYAAVVNAGPSVWRATVTAIVYLAARVLDHRSPPWNAMAVSASLLVCIEPLDVRDAGFALTFLATAAILEAAHRAHRLTGGSQLREILASWVAASVAASVAAEIVLLPVAASVFSRVTFAGVTLNLVAVPLMTVAQVAGLVVVAGGAVEWIGAASGIVAAWAAGMLVDSARLVDLAPWLVIRVPAPSWFVIALYYGALAAAIWIFNPARWTRRSASNIAHAPAPRVVSATVAGVCALVMLAGVAPRVRPPRPTGRLALTVFDVGQGDAILLQGAGGSALMVDTGGAGFDGIGFDIGGRVLAPALWARGIRNLGVLAITHADPDHIGGAAALVREMAPRTVWLGVSVPRHEPERVLTALASESGVPIVRQLAGATFRLDGAELRILHPPAPDWERQRVRNDDSLVMEVRHGDVAMLLTGDISAEVEGTLVPRLSPARVRILKVAHHGSRTSTGQQLLDAWKPQIAVISCGRGNRFGHPAAEVLRRLEDAGVDVYRTDRDGQIVVTTDGVVVDVATYVNTTKE
jgi:competence protein ComEC